MLGWPNLYLPGRAGMPPTMRMLLASCWPWPQGWGQARLRRGVETDRAAGEEQAACQVIYTVLDSGLFKETPQPEENYHHFSLYVILSLFWGNLEHQKKKIMEPFIRTVHSEERAFYRWQFRPTLNPERNHLLKGLGHEIRIA